MTFHFNLTEISSGKSETPSNLSNLSNWVIIFTKSLFDVFVNFLLQANDKYFKLLNDDTYPDIYIIPLSLILLTI